MVRAETPGTTSTKTPGVSKLAREAIIDGITGYRGLADADRNKGDLYKRAKLLPPFPGSKCRTVPDAWEEWWESAFAIQKTRSSGSVPCLHDQRDCHQGLRVVPDIGTPQTH